MAWLPIHSIRCRNLRFFVFSFFRVVASLCSGHRPLSPTATVQEAGSIPARRFRDPTYIVKYQTRAIARYNGRPGQTSTSRVQAKCTAWAITRPALDPALDENKSGADPSKSGRCDPVQPASAGARTRTRPERKPFFFIAVTHRPCCQHRG